MSRVLAGALLVLQAVPVVAATPPSAWVERQNAGQASAEHPPAQDPPAQRCRVVKEAKVGEVVARHRICDDLPKTPAPDAVVPAAGRLLVESGGK